MIQTLKLVVLVVRLDTFLLVKFLESVYFAPQLSSLYFDGFDFMLQIR